MDDIDNRCSECKRPIRYGARCTDCGRQALGLPSLPPAEPPVSTTTIGPANWQPFVWLDLQRLPEPYRVLERKEGDRRVTLVAHMAFASPTRDVVNYQLADDFHDKPMTEISRVTWNHGCTPAQLARALRSLAEQIESVNDAQP